MRIAMIGLGRMGAGMTRRLLDGGHEVVVHDLSEDAMRKVAAEGAQPAPSLEDVVAALAAPRVVWMMVPAGEPTAQTVGALRNLLAPGDTLIDGGNSRYTHTLARAADLGARGVHFVDVGTSGGIWGPTEGYCLMVGAPPEVFAGLEPVLATLSAEGGYARVGDVGAGHFTKMVHNGIEYALMQGYAEGFELLESGPFDIDLSVVAEVWRHGSVVRSWLLDLTTRALEQDPGLSELRGYVEDSGEGRWTVEAAVEHAVPAPTIAAALFARFSSRRPDSFANRLLAALRQQFGGHAVTKKVDE